MTERDPYLDLEPDRKPCVSVPVEPMKFDTEQLMQTLRKAAEKSGRVIVIDSVEPVRVVPPPRKRR